MTKMTLTQVQVSLRKTVNLGNYESEQYELTCTYQTEEPIDTGTPAYKSFCNKAMGLTAQRLLQGMSKANEILNPEDEEDE